MIRNNEGSYKTIFIQGNTYNIEESNNMYILTNPKLGSVQKMSQS